MTETFGRCTWCGGGLKRIVHATRQANPPVVTGCEHCDKPCRPGCAKCSKMLKTVRIKPD